MARETVTILIPDGYADADEFLKDCEFELAPSREPDLVDGDAYTSNDIAKRMWETFNSTGDRWFKYAAQRLERLT